MRAPRQLAPPFGTVRRTYFNLFFHCLYFDVAKRSDLPFGVLLSYAALGPTMVAGSVQSYCG